MSAAGAAVTGSQRALAARNSNIVAEILRDQGEFFEWDHYPKGEVIDRKTHSQYYYHAHAKSERPGEHGHFHTFIRFDGMPRDRKPIEDGGVKNPEDRVGAHLIGLAMDDLGRPIKMFTTNRWLTDETLYDAETVISVLDKFEIGVDKPSRAVNQWLSGMLRLFRPQIVDLIRRRDLKIDAWRNKYQNRDTFEDRRLEVITETNISVDDQISALDLALKA